MLFSASECVVACYVATENPYTHPASPVPALRPTRLSNTFSFACPAKNMNSVHESLTLHFLSGNLVCPSKLHSTVPHSPPHSCYPLALLPTLQAQGPQLLPLSMHMGLAAVCLQVSTLSYLSSSGSSSVPGFQSTKGSSLGDVCWG